MHQDTTAPAPAPALSAHAYTQVLNLIASGGYVAHQRLPSEERMARSIGVSRPVLRQALERLRTEDRIYSRKGSGHYASDVGRNKPAVPFGTLSSISDVRDFLQFRVTIEVESAALAAQADQAQHVQVKMAHHRMHSAVASQHQGIEEDLAFHLAVAQASGNRFYLLTMEALAEQMRFSVQLIRDLSGPAPASRIQAVVQEHAAIEAAIAARDPERARQAMQAHLLGGIDRLFGPGLRSKR
jgi:DNA-binding FadR family transcriptional regulator